MISAIVSGTKEPFKDPDGHKRWRIWVICPVCNEGRWIRDDCKGRQCFTSVCKPCWARTRLRRYQTREGNSRWTGGRYKRDDGYIAISVDKDDFFHPMTARHGYIMEHRLIMARQLKRCLLPWEVVHHINGIKDDNRIENLKLLSNQTHHINDTLLKSLIKRQSNTIQQLRQRIYKLETPLRCPRCGRVIQRKDANK